jgi:hypothetical protein
MATLAGAPASARDDGFFLWGGLAMAAVLVAGFTFFLAMGISSFDAPAIVHVHGVIFFGWVFIYVAQTVLATSGNMALHRTLGWIGALWIPFMVVAGTWVAVNAVQMGRSAPIYQPGFFLIFAPMGVYTFAGLSLAAIAARKNTGWHRRLHFCGMAALTGPGLGRLLPIYLVMPHAALLEFFLTLLFPLAGIVSDKRRTGRVHPAWWWGIGTLVALRLFVGALMLTPLPAMLYASVTGGTPGAAFPPFEFRPFPAMP